MKLFGIVGAIFGMLGVMLGAFGAHALKDQLSPYQHQIFDKAVFYQFIHAIALLIIFILQKQLNSSLLNYAGYAIIAGILFFSGSLYLLACKDLLQLSSFSKIIGPITPIGGLSFIIGWILLIFGILKS